MLQFLKNLLKRNEKPVPAPKFEDGFTYCEALTAHAYSPWHIRQLSAAGKKLGGGVDTPSLCGRKMGWDILPKINQLQNGLACKECVALYNSKKSL